MGLDFSDKIKIKNRHGLIVLVQYFESEHPASKLAIIQHGFSGSMEEPHIQAFAQIYLDQGYHVLLMDCTNSFNDADGQIENNTIQTHYDDLEDVIDWAATQEWYKEPFSLAGHSLGGLSILTYASKHPDKIASLFPAATVISGKYLEEANLFRSPTDYNHFKTTGRMDIECSYKENVKGYRPYSWIETMWDWNALDFAPDIKCPTLLVVGADDGGTPPEHQDLLKHALNCPTEIHVIPDTDHCYHGKIPEACDTLHKWLAKQ